jgi:hypothetical protein
MNIYQENGYKNRIDYLESLAFDNGVSVGVIMTLADILEPSEDFDGLITTLDDYLDMMDEYEF